MLTPSIHEHIKEGLNVWTMGELNSPLCDANAAHYRYANGPSEAILQEFGGKIKEDCLGSLLQESHWIDTGIV